MERLLADHESRRLEAGWAIWTLLMLEVWGREVARAPRASWPDLEVPRAVGL